MRSADSEGAGEVKPIILDLCGGTGSWSAPYREAGYQGPLDQDNNIPDPDSPAEQQTLAALAGLSLTHS